MKWQAIIVLMAIALGIMLPPAVPLVSDTGARASIGMLDVCHASVPALSCGGEMPCVGECPCLPSPLALTAIFQAVDPSLKPSLIPFQDERPPKA